MRLLTRFARTLVVKRFILIVWQTIYNDRYTKSRNRAKAQKLKKRTKKKKKYPNDTYDFVCMDDDNDDDDDNNDDWQWKCTSDTSEYTSQNQKLWNAWKVVIVLVHTLLEFNIFQWGFTPFCFVLVRLQWRWRRYISGLFDRSSVLSFICLANSFEWREEKKHWLASCWPQLQFPNEPNSDRRFADRTVRPFWSFSIYN